MTILVTGAEGRLGSTLAALLGARHRVAPRGRGALDITRPAEVAAAVRSVAPDVVVNCAAYNDVDGAEDDPVAAFEVNAFAVRTLARAARDAGAVLVHYGTDFVFDGRAAAPYTEEDAPNPQSVYAMSKLVGEWFARDAQAYVLRVASLFGGRAARRARKQPRTRMADAILAGREVHAFADRTVSPSYVPDVAAATVALLAAAPPPRRLPLRRLRPGHPGSSWRPSWRAASTARPASCPSPRPIARCGPAVRRSPRCPMPKLDRGRHRHAALDRRAGALRGGAGDRPGGLRRSCTRCIVLRLSQWKP